MKKVLFLLSLLLMLTSSVKVLAFEPNNRSVGLWGHYWSSSVNRDKTSHSASVLCFSSSYYAVKIDFRNHGQPIRPVHP